MTNNLEIPDFLKRTETAAQADARRAKYRKHVDDDGLTVVVPGTH